MDAWSNIQVTPNDPEIAGINKLEASLGKIPQNAYKIRELIMGFEVCHFKYRLHIKKIKDSIVNLEPNISLDKIGRNHIRHGENAWANDSTGLSLKGQQYIWAMKVWLGDISLQKVSEYYDKNFGFQVQQWLGDKSTVKIRLVRLLVARLKWDWKSYEELLQDSGNKELVFQICRMDICHYTFPVNLDRVLKGIGEMKPVENFEGCGSYNSDIKKFIQKEILVLNDLFKSYNKDNKSDKRNLIKSWLIACLMKTLKEQIEKPEPIIEFE